MPCPQCGSTFWGPVDNTSLDASCGICGKLIYRHGVSR